MQTFITSLSLSKSASSLDSKRLRKQIVENFQITCALVNPRYSWRNHPAVKMWHGHQGFFFKYAIAHSQEYKKRFGKDIMFYATNSLGSRKIVPGIESVKFFRLMLRSSKSSLKKPKWLNREFCRRHKSNLLRKDSEYYRKYKWNIPNDLPYIWPNITKK